MLRGLDLFKSTGTSDLLYRMTDDSPSSNFFGKQIPGWYLSQGPGEGDLPLRGSSWCRSSTYRDPKPQTPRSTRSPSAS